ncbi:TIGR01777 family oxidoreductase [Aurantivibrio infirmus]
MNLLITGGTGFIGTALCSHLSDQHDITLKTRYPESISGNIKGISSLSQLAPTKVFDVVINLAGEPIANKRWSKNQKRKIIDSRINGTEELVNFFKNSKEKPSLLISGSAIGYYGVGSTNETIDEDNSGDKSFSSSLCTTWENTAMQAESLGIRTCTLRTGIVLGKNGGALKKMLLPFKLGLGGRIGTGNQWMSWIHIDDLIGIINYCIEHKDLHGPINGTAPNPTSNAEFTKILSKTLKRPAFFHLPSPIIKFLAGEMGEELLLAGKKVVPSKILAAGYNFKYAYLEEALSNILHAEQK